MTIAETIQQKVDHLPAPAQEEVLYAVEAIESRYFANEKMLTNGESPDPFDLLAEIQIDGPTDLSERHDYYAHGKPES